MGCLREHFSFSLLVIRGGLVKTLIEAEQEGLHGRLAWAVATARPVSSSPCVAVASSPSMGASGTVVQVAPRRGRLSVPSELGLIALQASGARTERCASK